MGFLYKVFSALEYLLALKNDWVPCGDKIEFTFAPLLDVILKSIFGRSRARVLVRLSLFCFQFLPVCLILKLIGWNSTFSPDWLNAS